MRIIAATVLLLASFTAGALDLKGVSPGQPWEPQVIQNKFRVDWRGSLVRFENDWPFTCGSYCGGGFASYGTCPGLTSVQPTTDKKTVDYIYVKLDVSCFDEVLALMEQKFGLNATVVRQTKQNGYGARFEDIVLTWVEGDQTLIFEKYQDANHSSISLHGPEKPVEKGTL